MIRKLFGSLTLSTLLYAGTPSAQPTEELMRLSLDVMLYNQDLPHALQIAKEGLRRFGQSPYWLQQAAQIARWMGETQLAKEYYLALYHTHTDPSTRTTLLDLAHATDDQELLTTLLEESLETQYDTKLLKHLLACYEESGELERGVDFFRKYYQKYPRKEVSRSLLLLLMDMDAFDRIRAEYHRYRQKYGLDTTLLYRYARILFAQREYMLAFIEIARFADAIPASSPEIWQLYSDLALILQNESTLLHTLAFLDRQGQLPAHKAQLYLKLLEQHHPHKALLFARREFLTHQDRSHFFQFAYLAIAQNAWAILESILAHIPPRLQQQLEKEPDYYLIQARLALAHKAYSGALDAYRRALACRPDDPDIHLAYLWALIDAGKPRALEGELYYLQRHFPASSQLALPVALGYFRLQSSKNALPAIRLALQNDRDNWQIMLLYADILALAGETDKRISMLHRAWYLANRAIADPADLKLSQNVRYDYLRLALAVDIPHRSRYLAIARRLLKYDQYINLSLAAADPGEEAKTIALLQQVREKTPAQKIALATLTYDTTAMQEILSQPLTLPLFDKLAAQKATGSHQAYLSTLFDAVSQNPDNTTLSTQFIQEVTRRGATAGTEFGYSRRDTLKESRLDLQVRNFAGLYPRWSLQYRYQHYDDKSTQTTHHNASLTLYKHLKKSTLTLQTGLTRHQHTLLYAIMQADYRNRYFHLQTKLAYREDDETNNYLLMYGYKNSLQVGGDWYPNAHTTVHLHLAQHAYRDQNRTLGSSTRTQLAYTRYLHLGYPDIYYRLFVEGTDFQDSSGMLGQDYWQSGLSTGIGEGERDRFHRLVRPYASATLLYNNRTGTGYRLTTGLQRRVVGKDTLGVEGVFSSGIGIREEDLLQLRIRYQYW